jgi:hypothetical protein
LLKAFDSTAAVRHAAFFRTRFAGKRPRFPRRGSDVPAGNPVLSSFRACPWRFLRRYLPYRESLVRFVRSLDAGSQCLVRRPERRTEIRCLVWAEPWEPTMQSARIAASSSVLFHDQVDGPRPMRSLLLDSGRAASPANAALELRNRIEVWVNEGGAGGEANQ